MNKKHFSKPTDSVCYEDMQNFPFLIWNPFNGVRMEDGEDIMLCPEAGTENVTADIAEAYILLESVEELYPVMGKLNIGKCTLCDVNVWCGKNKKWIPAENYDYRDMILRAVPGICGCENVRFRYDNTTECFMSEINYNLKDRPRNMIPSMPVKQYRNYLFIDWIRDIYKRSKEKRERL